MPEIRVLIADDHGMFRTGIRMLLELHDDMRVVGEAADGQTALDLARRLHPDVMLLDLTMPGCDGLTTARLLRDQLPDCRILVLTQHEGREYISRALRLGVAGYVVKCAAADELVTAIRTVARGRLYLAAEAAAVVMAGYRQGGEPGDDDPCALLTEREREVLVLIARGRTNREVADLLHISPKTVDFHRANIMAKLNLQGRTGLARFAVRHGLVE